MQGLSREGPEKKLSDQDLPVPQLISTDRHCCASNWAAFVQRLCASQLRLQLKLEALTSAC